MFVIENRSDLQQISAGSCATDVGALAGAALGFGAACSPASVATAVGAAACVGATVSTAAAAVAANDSCTAATAGVNDSQAACVDAMGNNVGICVDANADGGGGGKVICTELCRNGAIEHDVWMADIRYSRENFSEKTMRGYHLWGIPYVKLMRKSPLFAKLAERPTRWFAEDIAYRMGVLSKPNY